MGKINAAWRVAMATMGQNFTKDEQAAGWPETLKHWQLAALQYPHIKGETTKFRLARARANDFLSACKSGDLPHTATTVTVTPKPQQLRRQTTFASSEWFMRDGFISARPTQQTPQPYDVTTYTITASDFAAWLAAQPETPSEHIAAWCAALGADGDTRPIVPPETWAAQSPNGLQRCDGTADGRLVRLADLVAWLMQTRELPCLNGVELVCTALAQSPSAANALYLLSESGYANMLKATHSFFYLPIMVLGEDYPEGTAADKGLAGAVKYMRSFWGESSAPGAGNWCGQHVLDPLAVRLSLAHRLWGYGRRGDDVAKLTTDTDPPAPVEAVVVTPASESLNVIKKEGWICKKAALVKANATTWPTIEADFNHASENGLSSAAKAPGHGNWFETAALAWAKQRWKITEPNGAAPIVNSVFAMAGTVHTTK